MLAIIGYQCLSPINARRPDLGNGPLGELTPVAAIAEIRGWKDFLHLFQSFSVGFSTILAQ